jgi:hypothetical protein
MSMKKVAVDKANGRIIGLKKLSTNDYGGAAFTAGPMILAEDNYYCGIIVDLMNE